MKETTVDLNYQLKELRNKSWSTNPGCYVLLQNKAVSRIGGKDKTGVLYIGKGDKILKRIMSLQASVVCNADHNQEKCVIKGHNALSQRFYRMRKHADINTMSIRVFKLPEHIEAKYLESYLIESYVSKFAELPPLNGSYGSVALDNALSYLNQNNVKLPSF